jgi:hypothetical protein
MTKVTGSLNLITRIHWSPKLLKCRWIMSMGILLTSYKPVHLKYVFYFYGATFVFMWSFQGSCFKGELIFYLSLVRPWYHVLGTMRISFCRYYK